MTISSTSGTLYFITERDPFDDAQTSFVKIGLVRDNGTGRSSDDRLLEHQTGNPRQLVVAGSIATVASVSAFETAVHQRLAPHRVNGEWFRIPSEGITRFIDEATHVKQDIERVTTGSSTISNLCAGADSGMEKPSCRDSEELHDAAIRLSSRIQEIKQLQQMIKLQLQCLGGSEAADIEGICHHQLTKCSERFDGTGFRNAHPALFEELAREDIGEVFRMRGMQRNTRNEERKKLEGICGGQSRGSDGPVLLGRSSEAEKLHAQWIDLLCELQPLTFHLRVHENRLKLICGADAGIEGICSWKRAARKTITRALVAEHQPELVDEFMATSAPRWSFRVNAWRPYRF